MQQPLGGTGVLLSAHGLGTMTWGRETDEHEAAELLELFVNSGGNYIDTAPFFGEGRADLIAGKLLREFDRDRLIVASHAGVRPDGDRRIDCSRVNLLRTLDESLRRLNLDYLDLWIVDRFDPLVHVEEVLLTMDLAVRSGRVRYLGVGNYSGWQLAQIASLAEIPIAASSVEYSLVQRGIEREHLPAARELDVTVIPWSALGRGVLTGKYRSGIPADSRGASPQWGRFVQSHLSADARRTVEAVATAASGLGLAPIDVALAWIRQRHGTAAALLGPRTVGQMRAALANADLELPAEIMQALDDVSTFDRMYPDPL